MCEYSLHDVASRPAKVKDKVVTTEFSGARGFAAVGELGAKLVIHDTPAQVAVCLLPGTELAFDEEVQYDRAFSLLGNGRLNYKVARFRQIDLSDRHVQHDALEFPNGQVLKLTQLVPGQTATVLQLPVATRNPEHVETGHITRSSETRVALNRVPFRPGMASMLMPNQGAVMLWQTLRSAATDLSAALVQSFRRLNARKQHAMPTDIDAEFQTDFRSDELAVTLPKQLPAQKPENRIETLTAASAV